jgi:hypothetical protein
MLWAYILKDWVKPTLPFLYGEDDFEKLRKLLRNGCNNIRWISGQEQQFPSQIFAPKSYFYELVSRLD